jgi:transcription elongation factor Elf1
MRIRISINKRFEFLHCPACGKDVFVRPKQIQQGWSRCNECGLDIECKQLFSGAMGITAVQEDYKNRIYDNWRNRQ